jgi:hypothetical protein
MKYDIGGLSLLQKHLANVKVPAVKRNIETALATSKSMVRQMFTIIMDSKFSNVMKLVLLTSRTGCSILQLAEFHLITDAMRLENRSEGFGSLIADGVKISAAVPIDAEYVNCVKYIFSNIKIGDWDHKVTVYTASLMMRGVSLIKPVYEFLLPIADPANEIFQQIRHFANVIFSINVINVENSIISANKVNAENNVNDTLTNDPDDGRGFQWLFRKAYELNLKHLETPCDDEENCPWFHEGGDMPQKIELPTVNFTAEEEIAFSLL